MTRCNVNNSNNYYRQCRLVAIQLAVIPGLHVTSVVLVEVGQAVVHEDIALQGRTHQDRVLSAIQPVEVERFFQYRLLGCIFAASNNQWW